MKLSFHSELLGHNHFQRARGNITLNFKLNFYINIKFQVLEMHGQWVMC